MNSSWSDLIANGPLVALTVTGLILILIESTKTTRVRVTYVVGILGLILTGALALFRLVPGQPTFNGMMNAGGFGSYFAFLFVLAALLTFFLSRSYLERMGNNRGEYYILVIFSAVGMMLIAGANDLMIVFLGIELMSVCLYVLVGFFRVRERSNESSIKYFLLGAFATGFLLYGIALVYGASGTTNLTEIGRSSPTLAGNALFVAGTALIIVAFSFKVAAVPFHMWAPDVYEGAPTTITGFMSTGAKAAAFAGFVLVFDRTFSYSGTKVNDVVAFIAAASMIVGNVIAIAQTNVKRMLAYSSVAHAGYMLSGVAAANPEGQSGVMFYLIAYLFMNIGAFGIVGLMEKEDGNNMNLDDYAGLSTRRPVLALLMAVFMFSLAGVPPFGGFFGKYYVFLAAVKGNLTWLAVIGVLTSLISAYYYLRVVVLMYFREGSADAPVKPSFGSMVAVGLAAALILELGIYPSPIVQLVQSFH
ncbi:MAG TPA: NADH-quinone oxidoreductase subunit N [Bacteroidota bacterium]|nr:NADH-quinone oxidoreductase subunit N [Bacteroidota bacterium]